MASPLSARTSRGAIVAIDPTNPPPRVVPFQYNPDEVVREIVPHAPPSGGAGSDVRRLWGAGVETVRLTLDLDAADNVGDGRALASVGVLARLSALELLLYPATTRVIANTVLQAAGAIEILPPTGPLVVLTLGPRMVVPVSIKSLTVTEQAFGPDLAPIRATVALGATVLTYSDLPITDPGHAMYLVHQALKEGVSLLAPVAALTEDA
ncbi:hypothetical protein [Propioniciclava sinopodophylli]|uniref:hypothetical protein n=1 Tax=Propioniciclava sinopodophylli TaxID=1837344 RepID=UPI00248FC7FA|nr:hypothetical protein [Propioniciclava sinopodophylli]